MTKIRKKAFENLDRKVLRGGFWIKNFEKKEMKKKKSVGVDITGELASPTPALTATRARREPGSPRQRLRSHGHVAEPWGRGDRSSDLAGGSRVRLMAAWINPEKLVGAPPRHRARGARPVHRLEEVIGASAAEPGGALASPVATGEWPGGAHRGSRMPLCESSPRQGSGHRSPAAALPVEGRTGGREKWKVNGWEER